MQPVAWSAVMIGPSVDGPGAARLRTEFRLDEGHGDVATARLHVSAHGVVESYLAGEPVSSDVLTPGFSSFEWRLRYRTYDVANALQSAAHAGDAVVLGLEVGHGWYRGRLGWTNERAVYGDRAGAIAQLEIAYADGHTQRIVTDGSWTAGPSDVLADDLYDGQTIDARLRSDAWLRSGFDDPAWSPASSSSPTPTSSVLTPYVGPPVVRQEELPPVAVWTSPSGGTLVDFGQNLVGWVKITTQGEAGSTITVRHAEVIEHDELGTRPLRSAAATDTFICSGGADVFEPTMTFHGFRYIEVTRPGGADHRRQPGGRRGRLRPRPDRRLRLLRRAGQPAAPQRGVEPARQLPRPADRLSAAGRAPGLDRRHRRLRSDRGLPVRRRRLPPRLAAGPGRRAASTPTASYRWSCRTS